jgi:hypothetical protein
MLIALCSAGSLACAVAAAMGMFPVTRADDAPVNRSLPDAVHYVAPSGVLVVSSDAATLTTATLVNNQWRMKGGGADTFERVLDGAVVNTGTVPMVCMTLDGSSLIWIAPGETLLVGPDVSGYVQGCICECGQTLVFVRQADCGGTCANCNGKGPCIDSTSNQRAPGFTNCAPGWGPGSPSS